MERGTEIMATYQRHLSGAARRLRSATAGRDYDSRLSSGRFIVQFVSNGMRRLCTGCSRRNGLSKYAMGRMVKEDDFEEEEEEEVEEKEGEEVEEGLWKKTILMGVKCQPLEFSGAVLYDSRGRRVAAPTRTPLRCLLSSADE
ncbi:uncharacterized protein LOC110030645 [Phalaenopsis equestris]|uniref:uncharacterized protein LOC110030645 n=1 Tax=Phalaenopsis equestris TaxID=78828 RepID=UPI0009E2BE25|nr:uncharacterized protein LOC110030645 [Phalaenopsis equestris]